MAGRVVRGERAAGDHIETGFQLRVLVIIGPWIVAAGPHLCNLGGAQSKNKDVFFTHRIANLDIGAVESAEGQGAIEREFHVAGAGGLGSCGGDMLSEVGRRNYDFGGRYLVVGHEYE